MVSPELSGFNSYLKVDVWLCIRYYPLHAEHIFRKVSSWKDLKPAPFPLCCIKAPDLSVILISLPFLFSPPSLQPIIYWSGKDFPPTTTFFFPPIFSKISVQTQWWHKLKLKLPWYFTRNLLFSGQSCCAKFEAVYTIVLCLALGDPMLFLVDECI